LLEQIRFLSITEFIIALIDITVVAYVLFRLFLIIRGTRAIQLIKGIIVLLIATTVSQWVKLYTINWLLVNIRTMLFVALPVVFQPELRRALEQIGRGGVFMKASFILMGAEDMTKVIDEIVRAADQLSRQKTGALIVIERETRLGDFIETGIRVDGQVTAELLMNVFVPNTPLHDGAVIVRGDRIMAAACFLPLTDATNLSTELGSRHRAAMGISEHSDAVAVVVSEETGTVSLANSGKLVRHLDAVSLREMLTALLQTRPTFVFSR
jgi:diadenylate cyclase